MDPSGFFVSVIIVTYNRRDEIIECIDSVLQSSYRHFEIIVVDNFSSDGTYEALQGKYANKINIIRSRENLFAGGGRNLGAKYANGDYLLFIDSDNIVDSRMVEYLITGVRQNAGLHIGLCGPFTYYKCDRNRLCWVNSRISLLTSRTVFSGTGELDCGQYDDCGYIKVGHIPNAFMIKKSLFNSLSGIDLDYMMHYEESDLAERVVRLGYDIALFPRAKIWHNLPLKSPKGHKSFLGVNGKMVFLVNRNRIIFMRKNSSGIKLFIFLVLFSNLFLLYNLAVLIFNRKLHLISLAVKGHVSGLLYQLGRV